MIDFEQDREKGNLHVLNYSRRSALAEGDENLWNREHLWPNSGGIDKRLPAYTDLHALRLADSNVNSSRGNKVFDDSDPDEERFKEPAFIEAPLTSTDQNSWEPPDEVKGDISRAMFYMAVRYEGGDSGEPVR